MAEPNDNLQERLYSLQEKFYDQQVKTNNHLANVEKQLAILATLMTDTRDEQADIRARLRSVEKWKYGVPTSALMAVLSLITTLVVTFSRLGGK